MLISYTKPIITLVFASLVLAGCATTKGPTSSSGDGPSRRYVENKVPAAQLSSTAKHVPPVPHTEASAAAAVSSFANYAQALQLLRAGAADQALIVLQEIEAQQPLLSGPAVNIGLIHLQQQQWEDALTYFDRALAINNSNPYAWNHRGVALRQLGQFDEAKKSYLQAIELDPQYAKAHFNLGVLAELYRQDLPLAYTHFFYYQSLQAEEDRTVRSWLKDLTRRIPAENLPSPPPLVIPQIAASGTDVPPQVEENAPSDNNNEATVQ